MKYYNEETEKMINDLKMETIKGVQYLLKEKDKEEIEYRKQKLEIASKILEILS